MTRPRLPFRADHVGSLLRTASLKDARGRRERGEITAEQLKAVEDREIAAVVRRQEDIGLQAVTDGEFRRAFLMEYDTDRAGGFEPLRIVPKDKTVVLGLVRCGVAFPGRARAAP